MNWITVNFWADLYPESYSEQSSQCLWAIEALCLSSGWWPCRNQMAVCLFQFPKTTIPQFLFIFWLIQVILTRRETSACWLSCSTNPDARIFPHLTVKWVCVSAAVLYSPPSVCLWNRGKTNNGRCCKVAPSVMTPVKRGFVLWLIWRAGPCRAGPNQGWSSSHAAVFPGRWSLRSGSEGAGVSLVVRLASIFSICSSFHSLDIALTQFDNKNRSASDWFISCKTFYILLSINLMF